jgi:gallate decarboxylase subunit D
MKNILTAGKGRTLVNMEAIDMGTDWLVRIFNDNSHVGAISLGEYDHKNQRASVSVITRLGHKDDTLAQKAAYLISKSTRKTVCVVAGVHVDNITVTEIDQILDNTTRLIDELIKSLSSTNI